MLSPGPINAWPAPPRNPRLVSLIAALLVIAAAAILGALGFEHIGGYLPCHLCLMQRTPYYVGVPTVAAALLAAWFGAPRQVTAVLVALFAALMLYDCGLAAYHAGVEWHFWLGPASCAPSVGVGSAADMLNQMENEHAPSCTDAALRVLGLSLAGWNALIAGALAVLGIAAARLAWRGA